MSTPDTRVAVVTGGARRLGRHLCLTLASRGYDIVVLYRSSDEDVKTLLQEIVDAGHKARALKVDISLKGQVADAFADIARNEGRPQAPARAPAGGKCTAGA